MAGVGIEINPCSKRMLFCSRLVHRFGSTGNQSCIRTTHLRIGYRIDALVHSWGRIDVFYVEGVQFLIVDVQSQLAILLL